MTSPDQEVRRLTEEGYAVVLLDGTLAISHVPYVRAAGSVGRADLLVPLAMQGDRVTAPRIHQAWWTGTAPKEADGTPLKGVSIHHAARPCIAGKPNAMMLCGQIRGREYRDHLEFVSTYVALLGGPAAALDPKSTARARTRPLPTATDAGPFAYSDTASARTGLSAFNAAVSGQSVGILGLGGTGSYVLDLVAKCRVDAIHLFDDDRFEQHSAFDVGRRAMTCRSGTSEAGRRRRFPRGRGGHGRDLRPAAGLPSASRKSAPIRPLAAVSSLRPA